jgi:VanZ family protein
VPRPEARSAAALSLHALLALYFVGLAVLMFAPVPETPTPLPTYTDKIAHVVVFFGLAGVWYWDRRHAGRWTAAWVVVASGATAGLVEVVQALLPYRSGDVADFVAGAVGALGGGCLAAVLTRRPGGPAG